MEKIYYARLEAVTSDMFKLALYDDVPPEENESRHITWALDWNAFSSNFPEIELSPGEVKRLKILIEEA